MLAPRKKTVVKCAAELAGFPEVAKPACRRAAEALVEHVVFDYMQVEGQGAVAPCGELDFC